MEKIKCPECGSENRLTVYGRQQGKKNNWISAKKIGGKTVYICEDCGMIFQDDALCEQDEVKE